MDRQISHIKALVIESPQHDVRYIPPAIEDTVEFREVGVHIKIGIRTVFNFRQFQVPHPIQRKGVFLSIIKLT